MRRAIGILALLLLPAAAPATTVDAVLFDFEEEADVARWGPCAIPEVKENEPALKIERISDQATSGRGALKLTGGGGFWPAVATEHIPVAGDWKEFKILKVDV